MVSSAGALLASLALAALAAAAPVEDASVLLHANMALSSLQGAKGPELEEEEAAAVKVGDILFHNKVKSKVIWDGRSGGHDFLKVKLLEGMKAGQTRMVTLDELSSSDPAVEKQDQKEAKARAKAIERVRKHAPPSRDSVRRRRADDIMAYKARHPDAPGAQTPDQL
uniref:Peptidylprolyl isomerase n=1 Tax=Alexandrium catenella TaxID=2925 RepID=A0A7S1R3N2_ALECA